MTPCKIDVALFHPLLAARLSDALLGAAPIGCSPAFSPARCVYRTVMAFCDEFIITHAPQMKVSRYSSAFYCRPPLICMPPLVIGLYPQRFRHPLGRRETLQSTLLATRLAKSARGLDNRRAFCLGGAKTRNAFCATAIDWRVSFRLLAHRHECERSYLQVNWCFSRHSCNLTFLCNRKVLRKHPFLSEKEFFLCSSLTGVLPETLMLINKLIKCYLCLHCQT